MKRRSWLVVVGLLMAAALAWRQYRRGGRGGGAALAGGEDPKLIVDQIWVNKDPGGLKPNGEYFNALMLLSDKYEGGYLGAVLKASYWDMHLQVFQYTRDKNQVRMKFLQEGNKAAFSYKITRISDDKDMNLRLELSKNPWGGPKKYFGPLDLQAPDRLWFDQELRKVLQGGKIVRSPGPDRVTVDIQLRH